MEKSSAADVTVADGKFANQPNVKDCTDCARCIAGSRDCGQMGLEKLRKSFIADPGTQALSATSIK